MNANVLFWMRSRTEHTPAHFVARWDGRQVFTVCGNRPEPGGLVVARVEAYRLQVHVCRGCTNRIAGGQR